MKVIEKSKINVFYKCYDYHKCHLTDACYFTSSKFSFASRGLFFREYNCGGLFIIYVKNYEEVRVFCPDLKRKTAQTDI